jgi:hypothetical protein
VVSRVTALTDLYAPALKTLVATLATDQGQRQVMEVFSRGAPRLPSMELGVCLRPPQGAPVKHLKLNFQLSHTEFSQFIRPMSSLTHLSMCDNILTDTNHSTIELPSVTSLDLRLSGIVNFRSLDFPAVETFTIYGYCHEAIEALSQSHRLYPAVTSFTIECEYSIEGQYVPAGMIPDFISLLPHVREVTFQGADPIPIFQVLRDQQQTDKLLWSHLSAITVKLSKNVKVSYKKELWTHIVHVVQNRIWLGTPISRITLPLQIIERGSKQQYRWLKEQVALVEC